MASDAFSHRVIDVHGQTGVTWLSRLPEIVAQCERRWSLKVTETVPNPAYNHVAYAVRADGTEAILKLGVPFDALSTEISALRAFDGVGVAQLLEADVEMGAMLLERLRPGLPLSAVADDAQATEIAINVIKLLSRPAPFGRQFQAVADLGVDLRRLRSRFSHETIPIPRRLIHKASALFSQLTATMSDPVLLHFDLHHDNILSAQREPWLAIDPKGVVGERECEVAAFLRNRLLIQSDQMAATARRVRQFAGGLGLEPERIVGWGIVLAVLSAWWSYQDHGRIREESIRCAELLETVVT